jgi:hypothetical protein
VAAHQRAAANRLPNTVVQENVQGEKNVYFGENIAEKEKYSDLETKNCDLEVIHIIFPRHIAKQNVHLCILQYPCQLHLQFQ